MKEGASRILVVDDEPDTCSNLQDILTDFGYQVDVAYDGPQAIELAKRNPYDVALLDLRMPGMDGVELYRRLKKLRAGTVAIVVTAYAASETAHAAREAGAWEIVPKPADLPHLLNLVDQALEQPLVLIVDDDSDLCDSLWDLLREHGYRVCVAHSVEGASQRLRAMQHSVVLIDMKLGDADGREVFRLVQNLSPDARTLLITGYRSEMQQQLDMVLEEGADAVCYKPFDVERLLATLASLAK